MKKKVKWMFAAVILIFAAAAYGYYAMQPITVEAETVMVSDLQSSFTASGTVLPRHSQILSTAVSGQVTEVPYQPGVALQRGDTLISVGTTSASSLELQKEQYRQQLATARQEYELLFGTNGTAISAEAAAKSEYDLAVKNYNNARALGEFVSAMEVSTLETQMNLAKQLYLQAQSVNSESNRAYYRDMIASYEKQLTAMEESITSGATVMPYDGVLWELYTETGDYVTENQSVAKIYRPADLHLEVSLLTEDAMQLESGQKVICKYADQSQVEAEVTFISQIARQTVSTIGMEENRSTVELTPAAIPAGIGAGYQADITFTITAASQVLTVSSSALVPVAGGSAVYKVERGKAVLCPVETGKKSGGRVEIKSGLMPEDVIIADPYDSSVKENSRVKAVA